MSGTPDAYDVIRRDVLARMEKRRLRPEGDLDEVRAEVHRAVDAYQRRAHLGDEVPLSDPHSMVDRVLRSITDFGPLTDLIARRDVEEIFLEGGRSPTSIAAAVYAVSRRQPPNTRTARSSSACSQQPIASSTRSTRWFKHGSLTAAPD